jgi:hypothetical protein
MTRAQYSVLSTEHSVATAVAPPSALGETAGDVGLLAVVAAVSQFLHVRQFGLYEDDYFFIAQAMGKDPGYLAERLAVFARWTQGRPIGFFLPDLLSWIGDKLGGLTAIYVLGFLVVVLNASLFYVLLRRRQSRTVALLGGLGFLLFPADTTKILLTHDFQLQPSLTFFLLASIAYLDGRRILPYVLIVGSLISYESPFVVFFGVPLLDVPWSRGTPRALLRHGLTLGGVFALGVLVRVLVGEGRAVGATGSVLEILPRMLGSMVLGPIRSLELFAYGPVLALPTWDVETLVLAVGLGLALAWVLRRLLPPQEETRGLSWESPLVQLLLAGAVLLVLAYPLAFTHYPPLAVAGRSTSVHLAATIGGSVIFAALAAWVLSRRALGVALVAAYLALLGGYYLTIQRDFVRAWDEQRGFWSQVAACCSDVQDGTVLIVETDAPLATPMIGANSWADPLVLRLLYRFPADWQDPPRLFTLEPGWTSRIRPDDAGPSPGSPGEPSGWRWLVPAATWDEHWEPLPVGNLIVLRSIDGTLVRSTEPLAVDGASVALKPPGPPTAWPPGPLAAPLAIPTRGS